MLTFPPWSFHRLICSMHSFCFLFPSAAVQRDLWDCSVQLTLTRWAPALSQGCGSMQHSSFTLMGFLAHPAVPITQPTPSVTQPLSPCLSHLSNPFPVHLGCDLSPGNEVKPLATSPTCLWEPLWGAPFAGPQLHIQTQPQTPVLSHKHIWQWLWNSADRLWNSADSRFNHIKSGFGD